MDETLFHLFFDCPFALACWIKLNIVLVGNSTWQVLEAIKEHINLPFFMEIMITFYWSLWMQRNDFIFRGIQPTPHRCFQFFMIEFALVILRAKTRHKDQMLEWLEALVQFTEGPKGRPEGGEWEPIKKISQLKASAKSQVYTQILES